MSAWETSSRNRRNSSRLRMDSYGSMGRPSRTRVSSRRELDKVMKKARRDGPTQSNYWNKKLLEAEEKDPNRWRHSGFKELYGGGAGGGAGANSSPHGSRGSHGKRSRSRSLGRGRGRPRVRSPPLQPRPRSRSRERERERERERRPHTPQPQPPRVQRRPATSRRAPKLASLSPSSRSVSSCSDESCSVCSPKGNKKVASPPQARPRQQTPRSRSRSFSVPRNRPGNRSPPALKGVLSRRQRERSGPPSDPRGPPPSPPPAARNKSLKSKRKEERVKHKDASSGSRGAVPAPHVPSPKKRTKSGRPPKRRRPSLPPPAEEAPTSSVGRRRSSPPVSCSDDSSTSSLDSGTGIPKLTLSERFGKMAQWSVDRRDLEGVKNMRITKESDSSDLKVGFSTSEDEGQVVMEGERCYSPDPTSHYYPTDISPPTGLDAWDDVRVRYKYYKDRGYLRDLTLDDYIKWEEWWYKYQEWLEAERYYDHWAAIRAEQAARGSTPWGQGKRRRM